jgi:hypothetical protein
MPFPCCSPAVLKTDSHIPCCSPAILRQCCVLHESSLSCAWSSPAISFQELSYTILLSQSLCCKLYKHSCPCTKIISFFSSMTNVALFHTGHLHRDWYASDNKLPRTGRVSTKRPKAGKSSICHLMPSPCRDPAMALGIRFQLGIFVAWQGNDRGMA